MSEPKVPLSEGPFLADNRIRWIRQRTCISLSIPTDTFDAYFKDSLDRARSAGTAREQMSDFFSSKYSAGTSIFFSSSHSIENVEIEEEIEAENVEPNIDAAEEIKTEVAPTDAPPSEGSPEGETVATAVPLKKKVIVKRTDKVDKWNLLMGLEKVSHNSICNRNFIY
jgi:hypothetical protein